MGHNWIRNLYSPPTSGTRKRYVHGVPFSISAATSSALAVDHLPMYLGGSFFASA
jgi:hypothetical protein